MEYVVIKHFSNMLSQGELKEGNLDDFWEDFWIFVMSFVLDLVLLKAFYKNGLT